MYYIGFAGLDHGCFHLEMYEQRGLAHPQDLFMYYFGFAGLGRGCFRLEMYQKWRLAHP